MVASALSTSRHLERDRHGGFTLLEVLIAFVILAVASLAVYRGVSSGIAGIDTADARSIALLHARSTLDEVGVTIPVIPGRYDGAFEDGLRWSVDIATFLEAAGAGEEAPPIGAYEVTVTVEDARGYPVTLTTYRLAPVP